jgi:antitoxin VapB
MKKGVIYVYRCKMPLNIKNKEVEQLAAEVAQLTGQTKTEAIRLALETRRSQLRLMKKPRSRKESLLSFLERSVWSTVPRSVLGRSLTKEQESKILGFGKDGV